MWHQTQHAHAPLLLRKKSHPWGRYMNIFWDYTIFAVLGRVAEDQYRKSFLLQHLHIMPLCGLKWNLVFYGNFPIFVQEKAWNSHMGQRTNSFKLPLGDRAIASMRQDKAIAPPRLTFLERNATENAYGSIPEPLDINIFWGGGMHPDPLAGCTFSARNLPCLVLKSGYSPGWQTVQIYGKKHTAKKMCMLHCTFDKLGCRVHQRTSWFNVIWKILGHCL